MKGNKIYEEDPGRVYVFRSACGVVHLNAMFLTMTEAIAFVTMVLSDFDDWSRRYHHEYTIVDDRG
jgi:hypothetical protein